MNIIIINDFAHCLKNGNIVYSATVSLESKNSGRHKVINDNWMVRGEKEMNLTGAEKDAIRSELLRYSEMFPNPDYRLPHNESVDKTALANAAMQM